MPGRAVVLPGGLRQAGLCLGLLGLYLALVSLGFGPNITDDHPFRQTQTAMVARYMTGPADLYAYITPVFGVPWAIPFEFPLYQGLAKLLSVGSGLALETAGRVVSIGFFLLCFWPLSRLLERMAVRGRMVVLSLVLLTPLYVFWSRSFMIESTALFFTLWYLAGFVEMLDAPPERARRGCPELLVAGLMAALVKITTFGPVFLCVNAVLGWRLLQAMRRLAPKGVLLRVLAIHVAIFAALLWWVTYTDAVKAMNPIGSVLQSGSLREWNYGSLAQRFDWRIWMALVNTTLDIYFPLPRPLIVLKLAFALLWLGVFLYGWRLCTQQRRRQIQLALLMFVLPYLIFTNLHRIHSYYQNANAVFLTLALGLALAGGLEGARTRRQRFWLRGLHAAMLLVFCGSTVWYFHFKNSHVAAFPELTAYLRQHTAADEVIIVTGQDWSPVIPYLAGRRALMLPVWIIPSMREAAVGSSEKALAALAGAAVRAGTYVDCGNGEFEALIRRHYRFAAEPDFRGEQCRVHGLQPLPDS